MSKALVIDKARALENVNGDGTTLQRVADRRMRDHGLPLCTGHHVASDIVIHGRRSGPGPLDLSHAKAQRSMWKR